jgi:hypothetical protein
MRDSSMVMNQVKTIICPRSDISHIPALHDGDTGSLGDNTGVQAFKKRKEHFNNKRNFHETVRA